MWSKEESDPSFSSPNPPRDFFCVARKGFQQISGDCWKEFYSGLYIFFLLQQEVSTAHIAPTCLPWCWDTTGAPVTCHTHRSLAQLCLACSGNEASASENIYLTLTAWQCEAVENSVDFMLKFGRPSLFGMCIWGKGRGRQGQAAHEMVRTARRSSLKVSAFAFSPSHFSPVVYC